MKTFVCEVCGHIAFDEAPVDCPVCGVAIENFENDPDAIKMPVDPDNPSETEKKHMPRILVSRGCSGGHDGDCTNVHVMVGQSEHVMESEHFIQFIDFYINRRYITRVIFTPKANHPAADVHLSLSKGTLSLIANCNVHGNWRTKVKLDEE